MQNQHDIAHDAPHGKKPVRAKETLCKRVRVALLSLGGEAHRSIVIAEVARNLGHNIHHIPDDLQQQVIVSFEAFWRDERKRAAYGFHLPFGEGSHRWSVRNEALAA